MKQKLEEIIIDALNYNEVDIDALVEKIMELFKEFR